MPRKDMPNTGSQLGLDESYGDKPPVDDEAETKPTQSVDEENAGATEVLLAKDKLPPETKEGDVCTFRVSKDFGDEFSLEYVKEGGEDKPPAESGIERPGNEDAELAALSEKG